MKPVAILAAAVALTALASHDARAFELMPETQPADPAVGGSPASDAAVERLRAAGLKINTIANLEGVGEARGQKRIDTFTYRPDETELPGVPDTLFRSSFVEVEPGGLVPVHSHEGRPAFLLVTGGTIWQHRSDGDSFEMGPGDVTFANDGIAHWWENTGDTGARIWVVDLCNEGDASDCDSGQHDHAILPQLGDTVLERPDGPLLSSEPMIALKLGDEFEGNVGGKVLRARTVTFASGEVSPVHDQIGRPNYVLLTEGQLLLHSHEGVRQLEPGDVVLEPGPGQRAFSNNGEQTATLFSVDIFDPADANSEN